MFDKYPEYISYFKDHALTFPLLILLVSILTGITLSQLVFFRLRSLAARVSGDYYPLLQRAMRGIPVLWGILAGGYVAIQIITLPTGILHLLDITFQVILIFSLTIMGSRLISGFIALQLQKSAGNFASTSILVNTIELVVYLTGFLFMLQSFGVSIAPLLTALGVGGLAVAFRRPAAGRSGAGADHRRRARQPCRPHPVRRRRRLPAPALRLVLLVRFQPRGLRHRCRGGRTPV